MLVTPKAKTNGTAFALGFVLGLAVICTGASNFSSNSDPHSDGRHHQAPLGLLLLVAAARQWRARPRPGQDPVMPRWLAPIDRFTAVRSLVIGVALSAINPKKSRHVAGSRPIDRASRDLDRAGGMSLGLS